MIIQEEGLNYSLFQVAWDGFKNEDSSRNGSVWSNNSGLPSSFQPSAHSYVVGLELLASQPSEVFSKKQDEIFEHNYKQGFSTET